MSGKLELRDPADLRVHALRKGFTALDTSEEEQWNAFVDGLSAAGPGGVPPLFITANGQVMDGSRRLKAAKQLGWDEIGCIVRPEEEAGALIIDTLFGQRNLTRCVKTYLAICILDEFVKSSENRRLRNLQNGLKTLEKPLSNRLTPTGRQPDGLRALAEKFGVSHETVRRAIQVHQLFNNQPEIKAEWEPKLLCGEKNLWNVLSAAGGAGADQSKRSAGVEQSQLEFWDKPFDGLKNAAPAWSKLDDAKQDAVLEDWRKTAKKLPQDLRDGMREVLDELDSE